MRKPANGFNRARDRRRRWGQNFLVNAGAAERIVGAFAPRPEDLVLEIGPGRGALTRRLAGRVRRLLAVEVDPDLAAALRGDLASDAGAEIVEGDALEVELGALLARLGAAPAHPARLIANLPFNIATPLLLRLLDHGALLRDLLVMVQREVAERILSPPGSRRYGGLSVLCQSRARVESVLRLKPGSFRPAPKVDAEVIRLTPRAPEPAPCSPAALDPGALSALLRTAFERRRKTLQNNLARLPGEAPGALLGPRAAEDLIRRAGLDPGCRPEDVPVEGYLALLRALRGL